MYTSKLQYQKLKTKNKVINFILQKNKRLKKKVNHNNQKYLQNKSQEYKKLLDNVNGHSLDKTQREIVLSEEDSTLVIAGAGSGKTLTILGRILYLIKTGINPKEILCISFTNSACENLKNKLRQNGVKMNILTFHKLGLKILKDHNYKNKIVDNHILRDIIHKVTFKYDFLDIFPNYDFKDYGDGDFSDIHRLLVSETKDYDNLQKLLFTFINLFKGNNYNINHFDKFLDLNEKEKNKFKKIKNEKLLKISKEIYEQYTYYLDKNKAIDFHDMINKAIDMVKRYGINNYKYIIVDEYQDTSLVKCLLLKEIKEKTRAKIMAVGDDFQSIYRFTGSNLNVFLNFNNYFPHTKIFKLEMTYRNSHELLDIMSKFILKNKRQISKKLMSNKSNQYPIYIYYYDKTVNEVLTEVINKTHKDVLILGRTNKDIQNINHHNKLTIHKAKGLEANNVIIVNLEDKINGFPNKIQNDEFLNFVNDTSENYPYEEERRLFYVAMTRTKNSNYLLVNKNKPSTFVLELIKDNKNIKIMNDICPKCGGILVKKVGKYGSFYGCKNFPNCKYTKN